VSGDRRGFSLIEMVIVLVLAAVVSTAAISMFTTQNQLNAEMTALGESQENARSAVQLVATELRSVGGGSVVAASGDRIVVRVPIVIGIICGANQGNRTSVYFPLEGRQLDLRRDADGKMLLNANVGWQQRNLSGADGFHGNGSRQACIDAGNGSAGSDGDYATLLGDDPVGTPVMIYRDVTYSLAMSALDETRRAFYRTSLGEQIELAQGFSTATHFEFMLSNDGVWRASVNNNQLRLISAVRLIAEVVGEGVSGSATGSATFGLTREIHLRNFD
jgi:prepilin-type N-terminal cleavage/methylation domain-containing protein